jgi:3-phenylpropionate/cinnamic acid dioxygenase small subunit
MTNLLDPSTGKVDRVKLGDPLYADVLEWLIEEATLLDNKHYEDWLTRLAPQLTYLMPVRQTLNNGTEPEPGRGYYHFDDNYRSLRLRVRRLASASSWVDNPSPRTRRLVTNLTVQALGDTVQAHSYLLLLVSRNDTAITEMLSGERRDVLHRGGEGGFQLARREILIDQSTVGMSTLSLFF